MSDLGESSSEITRSVMFANFESIQIHAQKISDHKISEKQIEILKKNMKKSDFSKFKSYDQETIRYAQQILKKSQKKDLNGVIDSFQLMSKSCVKCHSKYNSKVIKVLNKKFDNFFTMPE